MLDCPVSGTGSQAKTRDIVFYASGNSRTIARLRLLFEAFGRHAYNFGKFGNGSRIKYVANLLVAINNVASAEAMVLGMKAGLPPQTIYELIRAGVGNSRMFELRAPMMVKGRYDDVTGKIELFQKDMQLIGDFAKKIRMPTPLFSATVAIYERALNAGYGAQDIAAVCAVIERIAGFKRGKARALSRASPG
jgi:3-hydroxyisobutyrate dehydrogenase-like beta-hydroxyacid dehydrogenase